MSTEKFGPREAMLNDIERSLPKVGRAAVGRPPRQHLSDQLSICEALPVGDLGSLPGEIVLKEWLPNLTKVTVDRVLETVPPAVTPVLSCHLAGSGITDSSWTTGCFPTKAVAACYTAHPAGANGHPTAAGQAEHFNLALCANYTYFFATPHGREPSRVRDLERQLTAAYAACRSWAGLAACDEPIAVLPLLRYGTSRRIAHFPRCHLPDNTEGEAEVRTLHDAVMLRMGVSIQVPGGFAAAGKLPELTPPLRALRGAGAASGALGSLTTLAVEADPAAGPAELRRFCDTAVARYYPGAAAKHFACPWGDLAIVRPPGTDEFRGVALLVYHRDAPMTHFFHVTLSELFLTQLKIRNARGNLDRDRDGFLAKAKAVADRLEAQLEVGLGDHSSLNGLRKHKNRLARNLSDLSALLIDVEGELAAVDINRRVFETAAATAPLTDGDRAGLRDEFVGEATRIIEQAAAQQTFLRAVERRAGVALQNVGEAIGLHQAVWSERLTLILGVLAVVQGVGIVPNLIKGWDDWGTGWRFATTASVALLIAVSFVVWARRLRSRGH